MDDGERTDKKGGKQRNLPCGGYDSRGVVFRKTRHGVFRLPKARAVRVHRAVHIVCMSRIYAHRAAVYLENTRIKGVKRNVWMVARSSAFDRGRDHGRFCERGEGDFGFYLERDDAVAV